MARFQLHEVGTVPNFSSLISTATPGMTMALLNTRPFASVPNSVSSDVDVPCTGLLPFNLIVREELSAPVDQRGTAFGLVITPLLSVLAVVNPPKSGLALRLLPLIGK